MHYIPQRSTPDNIDLKDTWLTPYIKEYTSETPRHEPIVFLTTENKNNTLAPSPPKPHVNEGLSR